MKSSPRHSSIDSANAVALTLGERISQLRMAKKQTLRALSRSLGVSHVFLRDIETGKRYPSRDVLARLADELEVEIDELERLDPRIELGELSTIVKRDTLLGFEFRRLVAQVVAGRVSASDLRKWTLAVERRD